MKKPEMGILRTVIHSKAQALQAEAVNEAIRFDGGNAAINIANERLSLSVRYENCLSVLAELEDQCRKGQPLTTTKLLTSTHEAKPTELESE